MLLKVAFRYKGLDYLVADTAGNLYLTQHFCEKRTVYFKKLIPFINGNKKAIKYHGSNVSFAQLKRLKVKVDEIIEVY